METEKLNKAVVFWAEKMANMTRQQRSIFVSNMLGIIIGLDKEKYLHEAFKESEKWK